jgi:hypothetical protein
MSFGGKNMKRRRYKGERKKEKGKRKKEERGKKKGNGK